MKKRNMGFTQQLTLCVFLAILIVSGFVFLGVFYFSRSFAEKQAVRQANMLSNSIAKRLESRIYELEQIPRTTFALLGEMNEHVESALPSKVLNSYPVLEACRIHDDRAAPSACCCREAYRDGHNIRRQQVKCQRDDADVICKISENGFWRLKYFNPDSILLCYREPFPHSGNSDALKVMEVEIRVDHLLNFLQDIPVFHSGYIFITTNTGRLLVHPDPEIWELELVDRYVEKFRRNASFLPKFGERFKNGDTGHVLLERNGRRRYVYYTPDPLLDWRIGISCPYREVRSAGDRLCLFLSLVMIAGAGLLFYVILRITRKQMNPLQDFIANVRTIANGDWSAELSDVPSAAGELNELHNAFKYMQHNMLLYVDQLKNTTEENERMNTEIKLARKIQNRFLPQSVTDSPKVEIHGKLQQSKIVGGDLYEYFISDNKLYFAIGDVSGKGVPAALYMASIIRLFRYVAIREVSSAKICDIMNCHMCEYTEDDMYVTLFTGILDLDTGVVTFSNAGHPNPLLADESGGVTAFSEETDVPIGILDDYKYKEYRFTMAPGSKLVLFTDGITDAENRSDEFFGMQNLTNSIRQADRKGAKELVESVMHKVAEHMKGAGQFDDMTLVAIYYKAEEEA